MSNNSKDTEQLILEAATREFSAKGFHGARTTAIASEAGVTHAMLHYYFRSKEKLFERIFTDKMAYLMEIVFGALNEPGENIKDRICRGVRAHFDFLLNNQELPMFFISTISSGADRFDEVKNSIIGEACTRLREVQADFDRAASAGEISPTDVTMLVSDIVSLNVFPFLAASMLMPMLGYTDKAAFMEAKREENVKIILSRLSI